MSGKAAKDDEDLDAVLAEFGATEKVPAEKAAEKAPEPAPEAAEAKEDGKDAGKTANQKKKEKKKATKAAAADDDFDAALDDFKAEA